MITAYTVAYMIVALSMLVASYVWLRRTTDFSWQAAYIVAFAFGVLWPVTVIILLLIKAGMWTIEIEEVEK